VVPRAAPCTRRPSRNNRGNHSERGVSVRRHAGQLPGFHRRRHLLS
jgi:hypothetical protein